MNLFRCVTYYTPQTKHCGLCCSCRVSVSNTFQVLIRLVFGRGGGLGGGGGGGGGERDYSDWRLVDSFEPT